MNIVVKVLDSMHVHNFHYLTVVGAKMSLLLELIIVLLFKLIKKEDILVLGENLTQGLYDTAITAEAKYSINFAESRKKIVLSLQYD